MDSHNKFCTTRWSICSINKEREMAEIEVAGAKIKGGKLLLILPLLGTLGGGLWAGFEFYKDYMNMKEVIQNIDTTEIQNQQDQITIKLDEAIEYTRDIKTGLRDDILAVEKQVDRMEDVVRETETTVREIVQDAETRFENKRDALQNDYDRKANDLRTANDTRVDTMKKDIDDKLSALNSKVERELKDTETRLNKRLQRALDNPLAN